MTPTAPLKMSAGEARPSAPPGTVTRLDLADGSVNHRVTCPCGCGRVWTASHAVVSGSVEGLDLTLHPSLHMTGHDWACGWHGWLKGGVFTSV